MAIRYYSKIPRLVTIGGGTVNQQLSFVHEGQVSPSIDFGKECASDKLGSDNACGEITIGVAARSTGQEEFIKGRVSFSRKNAGGEWASEKELNYELRLGA